MTLPKEFLDQYVNKTVPFKFNGVDLSFDLSHALFSSFDIDVGSRLLLKLVARNVDRSMVGSIVDIGSGVGVLGIACAKAYTGASLRMRDRDALACGFSERNARRNRIAVAAIDHALFLDGIEGERYDLALCNVPAKAGTPVLDLFLRQLPGVLTTRGYGAIVVVEPIAEAATASVIASGAEIVASEAGAGHTAMLFRRGRATDPQAFDSMWQALERVEQTLRAGRASYGLVGMWGLPEFDTPSFATELALELCENAMAGSHVRRVAVINPGIGRAACYVKARAREAVIDLCGRDALALASTDRNLVRNGSPGDANRLRMAFAMDMPSFSYDLVVEFPDLTPRVDTVDQTWAQAVRVLKSGAGYVVTMPSSAMDRFERKRPKGFVRIAERKKKGFACAAWRLG
jgi:16S rRNA G1207 methylase RsmC